MRSQILFQALLLATLFGAPAALSAGRRPGDFQEPATMTQEDFENARDSRKGKLSGYDPGIVEEKPREIPWMFITLAAICIAVATPFAINSYVKTAKEIKPSASALKHGMDENPN